MLYILGGGVVAFDIQGKLEKESNGRLFLAAKVCKTDLRDHTAAAALANRCVCEEPGAPDGQRRPTSRSTLVNPIRIASPDGLLDCWAFSVCRKETLWRRTIC